MRVSDITGNNADKKQFLSSCIHTKCDMSHQFIIAPLTGTAKYIFLLSFIFLLFGCNSNENPGRFELSLLTSLFGDISIGQGKTGMAIVSINRNAGSLEFVPTIDMSLIDPPSWLSYKFEKNPVKGSSSTISIDIGEDAKPGIYRIILRGVGNTGGTLIEDNVTFHLVVKKSGSNDNNRSNNAMIRIKNTLLNTMFALLNINS